MINHNIRKIILNGPQLIQVIVIRYKFSTIKKLIYPYEKNSKSSNFRKSGFESEYRSLIDQSNKLADLPRENIRYNLAVDIINF